MSIASSLGRRVDPAGQSGVTLVELMVTMMVMGLIAAVFTSVLAVVQRSLVREEARSQTMDQARLGLETLDRDIRSGSILCAVPTTSSSPSVLANFGLSVYTQSNGTTRWIQYKVASQALQRRQYVSGAWQSWRTIATDVVNTSTTTPFVIDTSASAGSRLVAVTLLVNAGGDASNVKLASSLSIRNQSTAVACSAIPSG
jgi:prepilin-type N-terminal cleavage/methylation domain-containing protein